MMKTAFSTVACPNWTLKDVVTTAKDFKFDGVEIRGIGSELYAPAIEEFSAANINVTKKMLQQNRIVISCVSSNACIAVPSENEAAVKEVKAYIDLAEKIGAKFVRVMPTGKPYNEGGDLEVAKTAYEELCRYGEPKGVTPILETNGIFADTSVLASFLDGISCKNKGALWDVNHPYRFNREPVAESVRNLAKYIKYVHIKDSKMDDGELIYKLVGYGDFPIKEAVEALKKIGYEGFLSLEWVKRWNRNLEEPFVAIPLYSGYIESLIK